MRTVFKSLFVLLPVAAIMAGCASRQTPQELADARALYKRAASGPAATYDPAALHVARQSLVQAENFYREHPDSQASRDMAYIAARRAQLAEVRAHTAMAQAAARDSEQRAQELSRSQLQSAQQKLESARSQLAQMQADKQRAEERARDLQQKLSQVAAVKQDERGTVLTLSGSVLFAHGSSNLLASAKDRLDQVAAALIDSSETTPITIQGFTDSTGSDQKNLQLSQARAEAVRDYLASKGVSQDLIQAEGMGESNPVASNQTAEGRANNRRVEIIVGGSGSQPGVMGSQRGQPSGGGINQGDQKETEKVTPKGTEKTPKGTEKTPKGTEKTPKGTDKESPSPKSPPPK